MESAPPASYESISQCPNRLEKRGLQAALTTALTDPLTPPVIAWADEMRLGLLGCTRRRWTPRAYKLVQPVQKTYQWQWLLLSVDFTRWCLHWPWLPNVKQASLCAGVQQWQAAGLTHTVWDNAPTHKAKSVLALTHHFSALPPYAPELNPAERVFEEVRRWVEDRVFDTLAAKQQAVDAYLKELAAAPDRLRALVGWDWICAALPGPSSSGEFKRIWYN